MMTLLRELAVILRGRDAAQAVFLVQRCCEVSNEWGLSWTSERPLTRPNTLPSGRCSIGPSAVKCLWVFLATFRRKPVPTVSNLPRSGVRRVMVSAPANSAGPVLHHWLECNLCVLFSELRWSPTLLSSVSAFPLAWPLTSGRRQAAKKKARGKWSLWSRSDLFTVIQCREGQEFHHFASMLALL